MAAIYDAKGGLFSKYPAGLSDRTFPEKPEATGHRFEQANLVVFEPVILGDRNLGTLYLMSDMEAINDRLKLYGAIAILVIAVTFFVAYLLSKRLQGGISKPILALAETAKAVSDRHDYSVRAAKIADDELGLLTDAFNHMLTQIEEQNREILSFNQKLEQKVIERTSEMESANKELEAFSYSISHDLRAPLRSIHGYMNIFGEEYGNKVDDEGKRLINIVIKNSKKMGQLIDDLLAFSHLGRKGLSKAKLDMHELVQSVQQELVSQENTLTLKLTLMPLKPAVGDISMFRQVWTNLISNAIKYSRKKEAPEIEIGYYDHGGKGYYYIKDNGAGFDMAYVDKLFGVFQRLHKANEFEGTGVGLALVRRIIERHGGNIWAEAKLNEGAKFYFTIPQS